ncbi:MAG: DUF4003 family protein [Lawsonibacter sp.]|nr:DUF4003 family protein [Lawsonibacter sp.]
MKEQTKQTCSLFIENRNRAKSVFRWDGGLRPLACADICIAKGIVVDKMELERSREILNEMVGIFSNFRSTARAPITTMLAVSGDPNVTLDHGLAVYQLLKQDFRTSAYLPVASMIIAQLAEPAQYAGIAARTREIYNRMKEEHPFLTSAEDSAFCALLALSDKSDDTLIGDAERCFQILKPQFFSSNAVQSLGHVLALCDGEAQTKCQRTLELFDLLQAAGCKYGTSYELPTLGVLAMSGDNCSDLAQELAEIDGWLSEQDGFGFFSGVSGKQRLMYAGMIAMQEYLSETAMQTAVTYP